MIHQHWETSYQKGLSVKHINYARNEQSNFLKGQHQQNHGIIFTAAPTKTSFSTQICVTCATQSKRLRSLGSGNGNSSHLLPI